MFNRRFEMNSRDLGPQPLLPPEFYHRGHRQDPVVEVDEEEGDPSPSTQIVTGLVSHMHKNEFGFVGGEIFFHQSVVDNGREVKVGDQVVVEVESILSAGFPFKQNAKRVQIITRNIIPSLQQQQGQQGQNHRANVMPTEEEEDEDSYYESPSLAHYRNGMRPQTAANEQEFFSRRARSLRMDDQEEANHQRIIRKFPWEEEGDGGNRRSRIDHDNSVSHSSTKPRHGDLTKYRPLFQQDDNGGQNREIPPLFEWRPLQPRQPQPLMSIPRRSPPIEMILRAPLGPTDSVPRSQNIVCHNCYQKGHPALMCPNPKASKEVAKAYMDAHPDWKRKQAERRQRNAERRRYQKTTN